LTAMYTLSLHDALPILMMPCRRAQSLRDEVRAARNPVTCVPPSTVLILLAKASTVSLKLSLYWMATSIWVGPSRRSTAMGRELRSEEHTSELQSRENLV